MIRILLALLLYSSNLNAQRVILGDSNVEVLKKDSLLENTKYISQTGKTMRNFSFKKIPKDTLIKEVFVCMGTNDGFVYNKKVSDNFFINIKEKFPVAEIILISGTHGWGNNKKITKHRFISYYDNFNLPTLIISFEKSHFKSTASAHKVNRAYHREINKKICESEYN